MKSLSDCIPLEADTLRHPAKVARQDATHPTWKNHKATVYHSRILVYYSGTSAMIILLWQLRRKRRASPETSFTTQIWIRFFLCCVTSDVNKTSHVLKRTWTFPLSMGVFYKCSSIRGRASCALRQQTMPIYTARLQETLGPLRKRSSVC